MLENPLFLPICEGSCLPNVAVVLFSSIRLLRLRLPRPLCFDFFRFTATTCPETLIGIFSKTAWDCTALNVPASCNFAASYKLTIECKVLLDRFKFVPRKRF